MATSRQIDSARLNGAKSQGPSTPEGKARSAQNARKHGLSATILLASESSEQLDDLVDRLSNRFPSDDILDELLVEEMAVAKWRQWRTWNVEHAIINDEMQRQAPQLATQYQELDLTTRTGLAIKGLNAESKFIYNLSHYEAKQRHAYHKAEEKLKRNEKEARQRINEPDLKAA